MNASNTAWHARDLGLVQHHFRHEHGPPIARRTPGQLVPAVLAVPGRELAGHGPVVVDVVVAGATVVLVVVVLGGT